MTTTLDAVASAVRHGHIALSMLEDFKLRGTDPDCSLVRDAHRAAMGASDCVLHKATAAVLGTEYDPRLRPRSVRVYVPPHFPGVLTDD